MKRRRIRFLKRYGDLEWLATRNCPRCGIKGRLLFGMYPRERITCCNCGFRFTIKGRKVTEKT